MPGVFKGRGNDTETQKHKDKGHVKTGRDCRDAATGEGRPKMPGAPRKKQGRMFVESFQGQWSLLTT